MIAVGIEDLKPGMILERPVKNHQGILLLEAGARISKKNIRIFKSWGVTAVIVKGEVTRANGGTGQSGVAAKGNRPDAAKGKICGRVGRSGDG